MGARGERIIEAGDKEIRILFTNRALAEAEAQIGRSIFGVAQGLLNGQSGIKEIVELLRAGMQAARRDAGERPFTVRLETAYRLLDEAGVSTVAAALMEAVAVVLSYDGQADESQPAQDGADPN